MLKKKVIWWKVVNLHRLGVVDSDWFVSFAFHPILSVTATQ